MFFFLQKLEEHISLHEDLLTSTLHSLQEISSGTYKTKAKKLASHQSHMQQIKDGAQKLKTQPNRKELERHFVALEGAILTDIDNLKRKVKKMKLTSPEVNDVQIALENLEVS